MLLALGMDLPIFYGYMKIFEARHFINNGFIECMTLETETPRWSSPIWPVVTAPWLCHNVAGNQKGKWLYRRDHTVRQEARRQAGIPLSLNNSLHSELTLLESSLNPFQAQCSMTYLPFTMPHLWMAPTPNTCFNIPGHGAQITSKPKQGTLL